MEAVYYDKAVEMGSLVVSACFDRFLLSYADDRWVTLQRYESAFWVANAGNLMKLRRTTRRKRARPSIPGYAPPPRGFEVEHQQKIGLWGIKLPSADASIIRRTLSFLAEYPSGLEGGYEDPKHAEKRAAFWSQIKPAHFGVKIASKTRLGLQLIITVGTIIGRLSSSPLGRWLLLTFPAICTFGLFKKNGPTAAEVAGGSFKMWFVGHGFSDASRVSGEPDMEVVTRIKGPEIGYVTTPIILIQCALILLKQRGDLPNGGVFPPGIVFGPTDLQSRLQKNGISFEVISKSAISA
ncbi:saccharopine dehydrogenase-like oxidoreductase [Artemisia annua]|uniref:Saccharopine dehydrogenase-like oxidoreductase n=1 Tax=Artemisia annua TaxID=35608 RepID=A0A2U1NI65_ARTAN|nr:saccharopine dehydrogenase-like oxidoreductase [Artemisia annua]